MDVMLQARVAELRPRPPRKSASAFNHHRNGSSTHSLDLASGASLPSRSSASLHEFSPPPPTESRQKKAGLFGTLRKLQSKESARWKTHRNDLLGDPSNPAEEGDETLFSPKPRSSTLTANESTGTTSSNSSFYERITPRLHRRASSPKPASRVRFGPTQSRPATAALEHPSLESQQTLHLAGGQSPATSASTPSTPPPWTYGILPQDIDPTLSLRNQDDSTSIAGQRTSSDDGWLTRMPGSPKFIEPSRRSSYLESEDCSADDTSSAGTDSTGPGAKSFQSREEMLARVGAILAAWNRNFQWDDGDKLAPLPDERPERPERREPPTHARTTVRSEALSIPKRKTGPASSSNYGFRLI
ncbi:hypothetical protein ACQY0O_006281 [Thecaphora frezii]